ncbi:hypothetical protein FOE78_06745 [Microlunatus elymi]|uniref:Uncharacterized protein n=1 Tax=Microlunatus elymi TaxID=2596828 RepID=A0A516PWT3_9ACTN|nr:hypothetical protein [Microlunatus elymi]QDP95644.1 hypothetical protein FOE78_06745 [Microlunatus elymi]
MRSDQRRGVRTARLLAAGTGLFLILTAVGGYGFRWGWTGFADNDTLWDWLNLVLLPVTVACLPLWSVSRAAHRTAWRLGMGLAAGVLAVLVVGGYAVPWRWTGFAGNTLWDWLQLFLVPVVLPLVVGWMTGHLKSQAGEGSS